MVNHRLFQTNHLTPLIIYKDNNINSRNCKRLHKFVKECKALMYKEVDKNNL